MKLSPIEVLRLNKAIKKLASDITAAKAKAKESGNIDTYFKYTETEAKEEFKRLYYSDHKFTQISKNCIIILISLNAKYQFISPALFGVEINPTDWI